MSTETAETEPDITPFYSQYEMEDIGMPADLQPIVISLAEEAVHLLLAIGNFSRGMKVMMETYEDTLDDEDEARQAEWRDLKTGIGYLVGKTIAGAVEKCAALAAEREAALSVLRPEAGVDTPAETT